MTSLLPSSEKKDTSAPITLPAAVLNIFAHEVLTIAGLSADDAATVADCLIYADLCGIDSHGISRLPIYARRVAEGIVNPRPKPRVLRGQDRALRLIDGDNGPGAVVGSFAMGQAIEAAKSLGVGMTVVRGSNHFGAASYYAGAAVKAGCIGICGSNSPVTVTVWGSREPAFGTNPLAIAAPAGRHGEISLDMSTSTIAKGKILVHARKGTPVPEGWALDVDGNPTTDASAAMAGVLLPFGGPKGSGLALIIDLIGGVMSGAAFGAEVRDQYKDFVVPQDVGHFFIAVDIGQIIDADAYQDRVERFCADLKSKQLARGFDEILLPGERKARCRREKLRTGIDLDSTLRKELDGLAETWSVAKLADRLEP